MDSQSIRTDVSKLFKINIFSVYTRPCKTIKNIFKYFNYKYSVYRITEYFNLK